jgi:DNA repair exonuclease SbcCD nuclease subunit
VLKTIDKKDVLKLTNKSKIAMIADMHFNIFQKNNKFFYHMEAMMQNFMDICIKEQVDAIFILGDIFDTKNTVNTDGLIKVNNMFNAMSRICPVVLLPGNHDLAYFNQSEINLPANYRYYENIIVVDTPMEYKTKDYHFIFLPFYNDISDKLKGIMKLCDFEKRKVNLFSHFGVTTFKVHEYAGGSINDAPVSNTSLKKFNKVYLGHYHGYQSNKNITYVSSPLQSKHGDELSSHGFVIYDMATNTHKFIDNEITPKFITYELNKTNAMEMLTLENHYIRIRVTKKVSKELLVTLRQKLMEKNFEVKIIMDLVDQIKLASIKGWSEITFQDDETLITNFLNKLEQENGLPFNKNNLLEHLEITVKEKMNA